MTSEELRAIRKILGLTQSEMAERIGLSLRSYASMESGALDIRETHAKAALLTSLEIAVEKGEPMLATPAMRKLALSLANLITEGHA